MKILIVSILLGVPCFLPAQNVGIGTASPHPNAALEIKGFNKGLLVPRGDAATRAALSTNTAKGLLLYDTLLNNLWIHNGNGLSSGWNSLSLGTNYWQLNGGLGTEISNINTGGFWSANPTTVTSSFITTPPPVSGEGTRLMWLPAKAAFRAGTVLAGSGAWDSAFIGVWSFACGLNTVAKGPASTALGSGTAAFGEGSTAMGENTIASGFNSVSMGASTTASGNFSTAIGSFTTALGNFSTAMGISTISKAYGSLSIGRYNDTTGSSSTISWNATDPVFYVGNGSSDVSRSNAAVIYKNGNMALQNQLRLQGSGGSSGIELGNGVAGKEINAGRIGYGLFSPDAVDIVGGGTTNANRKITFFAEGGATFNGCVTATNISCPSDARLKRNITPLKDALQIITRLNGYHYYWKNENRGAELQTGVIAQELLQVTPDLVHPNDQGDLTVNYNGLIPYLIEAIKEQQKQIESLEKKIERLTKK
ncbi:MAG: tail fiber domain-containing protein [Bacteroidota bacterium]|nr:tail fiber domain-containing protein [Bacteroidota bacterium]